MKFSAIASLLFFLVFEDVVPNANGGKILSLSFYASRSHKKVYEPLIVELANRGHSITSVTPFKSSKAHKNIREIVGKSLEDEPIMKDKNMFEMKLKKETFFNPFTIADFFEDICRSYYNMSEVQDLQNQKFDLIFVSAAMNECTFGLIHHLQVPFIIMSPVGPLPSLTATTGTPSLPSFVPFLMLGYSDDMNFYQRVLNLIGGSMFTAALDVLYVPRMEKVYRDVFGEDTPSSKEIQKNVSLVLANSHLTMNFPRPLTPDIIEVGGMACRPPKPLPKDLEDFVTGAGEDGVIFFSMGSILQASTMPESYRKLFVNVFSKLKQRVLWKWETETMEDLPKNVKLAKWLPQQDVLGHPNTKMFITHGGLGSIVEAVYHGTPLVGLPMFADQDSNMRQSSSLGFAVTLDFGDLSEESLLAAINQILNEPKYNQKAKELSSVYKDRPQNPLENAVYWTEYIMRHKGAKHLRSPARNLNWFQYHSYDAVAFVTAVAFLIVYLIFATFRFIIRKCCGFGKKVAVAKKEN